MAQLAVYTFAVLRATMAPPRRHAFREHAADVFAAAARAGGFLWRAERGGYLEPDAESPRPRFLPPGRHTAAVQTLTLWADLESLAAFAHAGRHRAAMPHRREWFETAAYPTVVAWWVPDGSTPAWAEGVAHLERLADRGPSPLAFTLRSPFDPGGRPTRPNDALGGALAARTSTPGEAAGLPQPAARVPRGPTR
jgi:hypothetical protein